jgi:hypothetical protein
MGATIRFDTRNLEKIASITGGQFFRAKDNKGFENVMDTIDALEKDVETTSSPYLSARSIPHSFGSEESPLSALPSFFVTPSFEKSLRPVIKMEFLALKNLFWVLPIIIVAISFATWSLPSAEEGYLSSNPELWAL